MDFDSNQSRTVRPDQYSAWPDRLQTLLLRACLLSGDEAISAWNQWSSEVDIEAIDWGSRRLLAAVHSNLVAEGVKHPVMPMMKEQKQKTWLETNLLFHQGESAIGTLAKDGIPTMLTKGAALVLRHYKDYALRPMADLDVVIPNDRVTDAMDSLRANGLHLIPEHAELDDIRRLHAATFVTDIGRQLDLHWDVISGCSDSRPFWDHAEPVLLGKQETLALSATELLLNVCVHGVRANPVPPIRWVVDSAVIIRDGGVDWDRLVNLSKRFRFGFRIREALEYVLRFSVPVPASAIEQLSTGDNLGFERREFERITWKREESVGTQLATGWLGFQRFASGKTRLQHIRLLPGYLKTLWRTEESWRLPFVAIRKTARRVLGRSPG